MRNLVVRGPIFGSQGDEQAFYGWLKRIRAVQAVSPRGRDLHVGLRDTLSSDELRELRALFHRYALDTSELESPRG